MVAYAMQSRSSAAAAPWRKQFTLLCFIATLGFLTMASARPISSSVSDANVDLWLHLSPIVTAPTAAGSHQRARDSEDDPPADSGARTDQGDIYGPQQEVYGPQQDFGPFPPQDGLGNDWWADNQDGTRGDGNFYSQAQAASAQNGFLGCIPFLPSTPNGPVPILSVPVAQGAAGTVTAEAPAAGAAGGAVSAPSAAAPLPGTQIALGGAGAATPAVNGPGTAFFGPFLSLLQTGAFGGGQTTTGMVNPFLFSPAVPLSPSGPFGSPTGSGQTGVAQLEGGGFGTGLPSAASIIGRRRDDDSQPTNDRTPKLPGSAGLKDLQCLPVFAAAVNPVTMPRANPYESFTYGGPTEDVVKFYGWYKDPTLPALGFPWIY